MEELAKAIEKKYIEDITKKYPIHRFFILFILLLSSYIYKMYPGCRLLDKIKEIKLNFVFDFKEGMLASIDFYQLFMAIICTLIISYIYTTISKNSFSILSKFSEFDGYISKIKDMTNSTKSSDELVNYFLSKDISKELQSLRVKLKSYHIRSEVYLACMGCMLWKYEFMSYIDIILCFILLSLIFFNIWKSYNFYISDFLPYYISEQTLLGNKVKFGDQ